MKGSVTMNAADIKNVTCLGSGTIGASWALNFAMQGLNVTVYDISDEAFEAINCVSEE